MCRRPMSRFCRGGPPILPTRAMTGPHDSVIGAEKEVAIQRFINQMPARFEPAIGDVKLCGALLDVDEETGKARQIDRLRIDLEEA